MMILFCSIRFDESLNGLVSTIIEGRSPVVRNRVFSRAIIVTYLRDLWNRRNLFNHIPIELSICMKLLTIKSILLLIVLTEFYLWKRIFSSDVKRTILTKCSTKNRIAFTFDDGPHPIYTKLIIETLEKENIRGGFFILGSSIQNYLNHFSKLTNYLVERPRLNDLLVENYSSIEKLYENQEIFFHGWFHERISELNLPILIDHLSTLLIEFGLLTNVFPVYRSTWGTGTSNWNVKKNIVFIQLLNQFGLIPINWNIDTKDYLLHLPSHSFDEHLNRTLNFICHSSNALILMHDNRPQTVPFLRELIQLLRQQGHEIVSPTDLHPEWKNSTHLQRFRQYIHHLRDRIKRAQNLPVAKRNSFGLFKIIVKNSRNQTTNHLLSQISPMANEKQFSIEIRPNIVNHN